MQGPSEEVALRSEMDRLGTSMKKMILMALEAPNTCAGPPIRVGPLREEAIQVFVLPGTQLCLAAGFSNTS